MCMNTCVSACLLRVRQHCVNVFVCVRACVRVRRRVLMCMRVHFYVCAAASVGARISAAHLAGGGKASQEQGRRAGQGGISPRAPCTSGLPARASGGEAAAEAPEQSRITPREPRAGRGTFFPLERKRPLPASSSVKRDSRRNKAMLARENPRTRLHHGEYREEPVIKIPFLN